MNILPNLQKEGVGDLAGFKILQEGCWEKEGYLLQSVGEGEGGRVPLLHKKLTKILEAKVYKQKCFSLN